MNSLTLSAEQQGPLGEGFDIIGGEECKGIEHALAEIVAGRPAEHLLLDPTVCGNGNVVQSFRHNGYRSGNEGVCKNVNCGQGTCTPLFLGFDCECLPGWKKIQVAPLIYPSCAIPNCTTDLQCGDKSVAPLPPLPPPPYSLPPINLTSPCLLVWCGDGTCVPKDSGYYCQCNEGSGNLFDNPVLACFKQCSFQGDCKNVTIGPPGIAPAPSLAHEKGWNEVSYWSRIVLVLTLALSTMTFAT